MICQPGLWAKSRLKPAAQSRAEPEPGGRLTAAYSSGFKFGKPFSQAQAQAWGFLGRSPWLRLQAAGHRSHHRSERSLTPSQQDSHSAQRQNDTLSPCGNRERVGFGPLPTPHPHPKRERISSYHLGLVVSHLEQGRGSLPCSKCKMTRALSSLATSAAHEHTPLCRSPHPPFTTHLPPLPGAGATLPRDPLATQCSERKMTRTLSPQT